MTGMLGKAINDVLAEDSKGKATCKTCGASGPPWNHVPSVFDSTGIGDPGHKMENPSLSSHVEYPIKSSVPDNFDRIKAEELRDEIETQMNNAYALAHYLQEKYNEIDEQIENYNQEQAALDE